MINNINSTGGGPCTAPMQGGGSGNGTGNPPALRKVMVVAEPNRESVVALQYALSHVLFEQDELILLHVENQNPSWKYTFSTFLKRPSVGSSSSSSSSNMGSSEGGGSCGAVPVDVDFLEEMKSACKVAHPKVRVRVERVEMEGKDKANTILFQSHQLGIDVIVIGQRRSLSTAILGWVFRVTYLLVLISRYNMYGG